MHDNISNFYQATKHLKAPEKVDATVQVTNQFSVSSGDQTEIPMLNIVRHFKTNLKFKLAVITSMAWSVGQGFFNSADTSSPTGRRALDLINNFAEDWDLDTINQKIARDVWMSGNAFLNRVGSAKNPVQGIYMLPLSAFQRVYRDESGHPLKFLYVWGNWRNFEPVDANLICHFPWLPIDESAFGEGLGQSMARHGTGYKTENGNTVVRPPWFEIAEKMEDTTSRMVYAGLPRYAALLDPSSPTGSDENVTSLTNQLNKLDPLQHIVANVKGTIETIALDTQNRFDSFLRYIDDQIVSGTMSPLIRLWSSMDFTYASSKSAVEAMTPMISMYQRAHKRFIEKMIYQPLMLQEGINPRLAGVKLNWGKQDKMAVADIAELVTLLSNPMFDGEFDPQDILKLLRDNGVPLSEVNKSDAQNTLNQLKDVLGRADAGKTIKLSNEYLRKTFTPAQLQQIIKDRK